MAEFDFRIPSKVPYGYISFHGSYEEFLALDLEGIAADYASSFLRYKEAEAAALAAGPKRVKAEPDINQELSHEAAGDLIKRELGGVEVPDDAPWGKDVESKPKPWAPDAKPTVPAASSDDWDFG